MKVKSESEFAQSCPTFVTPWTAAHQAPSSMGFLFLSALSYFHKFLINKYAKFWPVYSSGIYLIFFSVM